MTTDLFLNIDTSSIDWARAQFALTAIYHWLFVPLTLGLAVIMGIRAGQMDSLGYITLPCGENGEEAVAEDYLPVNASDTDIVGRYYKIKTETN